MIDHRTRIAERAYSAMPVSKAFPWAEAQGLNGVAGQVTLAYEIADAVLAEPNILPPRLMARLKVKGLKPGTFVWLWSTHHKRDDRTMAEHVVESIRVNFSEQIEDSLTLVPVGGGRPKVFDRKLLGRYIVQPWEMP